MYILKAVGKLKAEADMGVILTELRKHAPFTIFGAVTGVLLMVIFQHVSDRVAYSAFYVFHPLHVVLSALVTSSIYKFHVCPPDGHLGRKCNLWALLAVGYAGAIGIATISDSLIPFLGEVLLDMPHREPHIGFIEKWWLINPLAVGGVLISYKWPSTKFPHAGHVLISTWASLFHMMTARGPVTSPAVYAGIAVFLFLAVWLPCCVSDIIFPLLFVKGGGGEGKGAVSHGH
jgi:hypothetical protein